MRTSNRFLAVTAAALLLGASLAPVSALDVNLGVASVTVGGSGNGGTTATVGTGSASTTVSATLGGGSNLASASVGTGGSGLTAGVGTNEGPLLTTSNTGDNTNADVNLGLGGLGGTLNDLVNTATGPLGDIVDDLDPGLPGLPDPIGGPTPIGDPPTPIQITSAFGSLSSYDQGILRNRCRTVLVNPARFEPGVVELCRIIARMQLGVN